MREEKACCHGGSGGGGHPRSKDSQRYGWKISKTLLLSHNMGHPQQTGALGRWSWLRTWSGGERGEEGVSWRTCQEVPTIPALPTMTGNFRRKKVEEKAVEGEKEEAPRGRLLVVTQE